MKKTFAALLALVLAFTVFTVVPSAAGTNPEYELKFTDKAPIVDGDISSKEYGSPLISWTVSDGEEDGIKLDLYEIKDDPDLSIDFYATWTETDLYLAWKVHTKYDFRVPDGVEDGYMYEYCCVQFILTPGAPDNSTKKYQTSEWSGDYLEVGLTMRDDGLSYKVCWSQPVAAGNALQTSDWEFAGSRDNDKEISIYECRLPLNKTGIEVKGDGAQFGLTWAVGAQENYEKVTKGLIEWQDAIVGGKAADNSAIMTMTGSGEDKQEVEVGVVSRDKCPHGDLPDGLEESLMQITLLGQPVTAEQTTLILDPANINNYNPKYAHTLLLRPAGELKGMEGYYTVVEGVTGSGGDIAFTSEVKDGDIAVILHTDSSDSSSNQTKAVELAKTLTAGQLVYLHGVEKKDGGLAFLYNNAQLVAVLDAAAELNKAIGNAEALLEKKDEYTEESIAALQEALEAAKAVNTEDQEKVEEAYEALKDAIAALVKVESETSSEPSSEAQSSASSGTQSDTSSAASTSNTSSDEGESDGPSGGLIALIVGLAVVVIGAAVAVIVIVRKKKA